MQNSLRKGYMISFYHLLTSNSSNSGNVNTTFHEDSCACTVSGACSASHLDLMKLWDTICSSCCSEKASQIHSLCMHIRHYTYGK